MSAELHYISGEEVHAGDRVTYDGGFATVVFVSDGANEEYAPGFEDYIGSERGILISDDDGETSSIGEPDERLAFVDRG
jgi:hypothetical protein